MMQEAAILGALCFVMALVVLLFFSSVLLNIVDAVFMCYALDLDTQSVTKSEVHEVFSQVRSLLSAFLQKASHSCISMHVTKKWSQHKVHLLPQLMSDSNLELLFTSTAARQV